MAVGILLAVCIVDAGVTGWLLSQYIHLRKAFNVMAKDVKSLARVND